MQQLNFFLFSTPTAYLPLLQTNSTLEAWGKFSLFLFVICLACGLYFLVKYALALSQANASLKAENHQVSTQNIIMAATLEAEKKAASWQGRLEGLMVNLNEVADLHKHKAINEVLSTELKALRTGRKTLIEERDRYLNKSNQLIDRLDEANERSNKYYFRYLESKGDRKKLGESSGKVDEKLGESSAEVQGKIKPFSNYCPIPSKSTSENGLFDRLVILPPTKGKSFYLDKVEDKPTGQKLLGVFHNQKVAPVLTLSVEGIHRGEYYPLRENLGLLLCGHEDCFKIKLGDTRLKQGSYCSADCRKAAEEIRDVS